MQFHHIFISFTDFQEPSLLYNTNFLLNASRNKANACGQRKLKQRHFYCQLVDFQSSFTDIISYQMAFYSTSSTVQKLIMAMISFPRNLSVNMMLPCYSGICPPQTCTVRPWSTGSLVDNAEWPPDPEHTRCTCYREICVGNTPHSDLVCTGNQDLWKSNIIISDRKHFRFQRFHFN